MKSDYVSLWYTLSQFRKLRASKGSDIILCNDTEYDLHLIILNTLHWQLPFHSTLVTRRPYLGHDKWRLRYRFFSHYKAPLTSRYSWKRLRKRRSKNLIKFPQVYIAFVLWYVHCFEKKNTYWLNESWKTRLPKRLKCTIVAVSSISIARSTYAGPCTVGLHCQTPTLMPECQAGRQLVPFLWWFLVWPGRGAKPRPTTWEVYRVNI